MEKKTKDNLIRIIRELPTQEDSLILGFNASKVKGIQNFLTLEEKNNLISKIRSDKLSKAASRRMFAALSGALRLSFALI